MQLHRTRLSPRVQNPTVDEFPLCGQSCCSFVLVVPITSACASHQTWTNQTQLKAQLPLMPLRQLVFFLHPSALALSRILAAG